LGARPARPQARRGSRILRNRGPMKEGICFALNPLAAGKSIFNNALLNQRQRWRSTGNPMLRLPCTTRANSRRFLKSQHTLRMTRRVLMLVTIPQTHRKGCGFVDKPNQDQTLTRGDFTPQGAAGGPPTTFTPQNPCDTVTACWAKPVTPRNAIDVLRALAS
jgi:hypothetical protein